MDGTRALVHTFECKTSTHELYACLVKNTTTATHPLSTNISSRLSGTGKAGNGTHTSTSLKSDERRSLPGLAAEEEQEAALIMHAWG